MRNQITLKFAFSILVVLLLGLSSCNPVYFPNSINSPMLKTKGEGQVNALVGFGGFELQSAYALTDNFGLMLNGSYLPSTSKDSIKEVRTLAEAGLGYSYRFSEFGTFEVFGGGGFGSVPADFRNSDYDGTQKAELSRFFIQPAMGISSKLIDFSFATRVTLVNAGGETNLFFEPGVIAKIGYKKIKFIGTLGASIPAKDYNQRNWDHNPFIISLGLHYNFGRKFNE